MGKTILTPEQLDFLESVQEEKSITKKFYLTGGTALSEFYFKHRLSKDIDLFSEEEFKPQPIESFLKKIAPKIGVSRIVKEHFLGLYTYKLHFRKKGFLKVDFNYYPFPRIEKGTSFGKLEVSSIYDIAVNKLHTICMKPRARDYVDLFFIFKKARYSPEKHLQKMRIDSQAKFDWPLELKNLVASFLRVKDLEIKDFPKMLIPFKRKEMEDFFLKLAKGLEKEIFK